MSLGGALVWAWQNSAAAPSLTSLNYDQADTAGGGQSIVATGTNLSSATSVTVGGTSATITGNTSTTVTFTMPAKAAGSHNVVVTTAGGSSNALTIEAWDPGQITGTTGWWENYTGGATLAARSGSVAGSSYPVGTGVAAGPTVGGFGTVDCKNAGGTSGRMATGDGGTHPTTYLEQYVSITSGSPGGGNLGWCLFKPDAASAYAGAGSPYNNAGLLGTGAGGYFILGHSDAGVTASWYDGNYNEATKACTTGTGNGGVGAWHMAVLSYDGTNLRASVDGSSLASASVAKGFPNSPGGNNTYTIHMGNNYNAGGPFDGLVLAWGFGKEGTTDANVTKLRKWGMQRFGVTV